MAEEMKDVPNLVFAQIDNAANEIEGIEIKNTPVLKFFSKGGDRKPVDFDGTTRDQDTIEKWLWKHSPNTQKYLDSLPPKEVKNEDPAKTEARKADL